MRTALRIVVVLAGVLAPQASDAQLVRPPFVEVIEVVTAVNPITCPQTGGLMFSRLITDTYTCEGAGPDFTGASLNGDEIETYTGIPGPAPPFPCLSSVPGPFVINLCKPTSCETQEAAGDRANCAGDPVDLASGLLDQTIVDFDLGHGLRFARRYSGLHLDQTGPMGRGWQHSLEWKIVRNTSGALPLVLIQRPHRSTVAFVWSAAASQYNGSQRSDGMLAIDGSGVARYTDRDGTVVTFDASNALDSIEHPGEPAISVTPGTDTMTYSNGMQTIVVTTTSGKVSGVTGSSTLPGGTPVTQSWSYDHDGGPDLETVEGPDPTDPEETDRTAWTYLYESGGRLKEIKRGTTTLASWTYHGGSKRVASADEPALDQKLHFSYANTTTQTPTTTVSDDSSEVLAEIDFAYGGIEQVTTSNAADAPANPLAGAVNPVPGGPGLPVPFASGATDAGSGAGRWQTKTDKNGRKTRFENYDARGNPGRVIEGWTSGLDGARRRDFVYGHPTLATPTQITEASALTGVFGDRVTTRSYDDPSDSPDQGITTRLYSETLQGKRLAENGSVEGFTDVTTYTYNAAGRVTSISGPAAAQHTTFVYDGTTGYRTAVRRYLNGSGSSYLETTYSNFDARGNPQTVTDPNGRATAFTYDALSRVKTVTPPYPTAEHAGTATSSTITFTYDLDGNLAAVQFPNDDDNAAVILTMRYDAKQRLTSLSDSQGNALVYEYANGRMVKETRRTGFVPGGSAGTEVGKAEFDYDLAGRLVQSFNPLFTDDSVFTAFGPDGNGNPVSVTDENGKEDILVYDALDRLTEIQQVRTGTFTTSFAYDALSNVTEVTDAASRTTDLRYDDRGNLVETVSPDTGRTRFLYDAAGNLTKKLENAPASSTTGARITSYSYDGLNRLLSINLPNDADWTFTYDSDADTNQKGRLASVSNGTVTTSFEYTQRGDVAKERTTIDGVHYDVGYAYDAAGNRSELVAPSGRRIETSYAGLRPSQLTITAGSRVETIENIAWHPFGPRTSALLPPRNGSNANTVLSTRLVNLRGQIEEVKVVGTGTPATLVHRQYGYAFTSGTPGPIDKGPNLDRMEDLVEAGESRFYFYDALDRLKSTKSLTGSARFDYTYSASGNVISKLVDGATGTIYGYETGTNRLASAGTGTVNRYFAHDAYGNRIYDGSAPYDDAPSLRYDDSNRLVEVFDPEDEFASLVTYTYDAFGRRVRKDPVGTGLADAPILFFYDTEGHLIEEVRKLPGNADHGRTYFHLEDELMAVVDEAREVGTLVLPAEIPWILRFDPPWWVLGLAGVSGVVVAFAMRRVSPGLATAGTGVATLLLCAGGTQHPTFFFVHTDPLGTPIAVTRARVDTTPADVIWRASHEPFGATIEDQDPDGDGTPFSLAIRFPGQYEDAETGWHDNGFRGYDPGTGRYLQADPIGLFGGLNLYAYVTNDPINSADPYGLFLDSFRAKCLTNPLLCAALGGLGSAATGAATSAGLQYAMDGCIDVGAVAIDAGLSTILGSAAVPRLALRGLSFAERRVMTRVANTLRDHAGPRDIAGAIGDALGNPVRKASGGTWDHLTEVSEALRGLRRNLSRLEGSTHGAAQAVAGQAARAIDAIEGAFRGLGI